MAAFNTAKPTTFNQIRPEATLSSLMLNFFKIDSFWDKIKITISFKDLLYIAVLKIYNREPKQGSPYPPTEWARGKTWLQI